MKTKSFVKGLLFASVLPFCSFAAVDNDDPNQEEVQFINSNSTIIDGENETLQVPVTATLEIRNFWAIKDKSIHLQSRRTL